jgi:hypothetical protein
VTALLGLGPACSRKDDAGGALTAASIDALEMPSLLKFVPAETPYFFVGVQAPPADVRQKLAGMLNPVFTGMKEELARELATPPGEMPGEKSQRAFIEVFSEHASFEGLAQLGFTPEKPFVLYGLGLLPAFRVELTDAELFRKFIQKIETKAGSPAPTAKLGDQDYWVFGEGQGDGVVVLALVGNQLVGAFVLNAAREKTLSLLFGQTQPQASLADGPLLRGVMKQYGFTGHGVGVVDLKGLVSTLLGEGTGTNADTYAALAPRMPSVSDDCRAEYKSLVAKAPRLVFGNESLTSKGVQLGFTLELESSLAQGLMNLRARVPGLAAKPDTDQFFQFGLGLDLEKVIGFVQERAAAITAAPFKCELLAGLNRAAMDSNQMIAAATFGPAAMARLVRGVNVVVKDLATPTPQDTAAQEPLAVGNARGYIALATPSPEQVLTSAKALLPGLATLTVAKDGKPVSVPPEGLFAQLKSPHIAMGESALLVSSGEGMQADLTALATAKGDDAQPVLVFAADAGRMLGLHVESQTRRLAAMPSELQANTKDELEALRLLSQSVGHTAFVLSFREKGIYLMESAVLK